MTKAVGPLRAIDLYSGVGGWSLGLHLAGINVVASYDRWEPANLTNSKNNHHVAHTVNIRQLDPVDLPGHIDIIVGSPPCTEFSYSNRGGGGNLENGLQDIIKFLTIVDYVRPRAWAMENVPRVAKVIEKELQPGGTLWQFKHLNIRCRIVKMEDYGLPQRRRRCIAGNFDMKLLEEYANQFAQPTLGMVVAALSADPVVDPIYGISVSLGVLRDHVKEIPLDIEEVRINRAAKTIHPIYNSMSFPDPLDRSVRTITATCTRVARESIVIRDPSDPDSLRRLTIRERASLQGFPISFQFYGSSYRDRVRMVGNAIPPPFAYYVAQAFQKVAKRKLPCLTDRVDTIMAPGSDAQDTVPEKAGARYPLNRTFRFAIPSLRLKSGVRFELVNDFRIESPKWKVAFYFGTSKEIRSLSMDKTLRNLFLARVPKVLRDKLNNELRALTDFVAAADLTNMQRVWSRNGPGSTRPFMLLDQLDEAGSKIGALMDGEPSAALLVTAVVADQYGQPPENLPGFGKLARNSALIAAGLLVGSAANVGLARHAYPIAPTLDRVAS